MDPAEALVDPLGFQNEFLHTTPRAGTWTAPHREPGAPSAPGHPCNSRRDKTQSQVYFVQSSNPTTTPEVGVKPFRGVFFVMNSLSTRTASLPWLWGCSLMQR